MCSSDLSLAERKSRLYLVKWIPDRKEETVTNAIINLLKDFPNEAVKTITCDRGKEFAGWETIEKELNTNVYFADPYCAWQKGTNENSNGLLREFYPKGTDLSKTNEKEVQEILKLLNNKSANFILINSFHFRIDKYYILISILHLFDTYTLK